MLCSQNCNKSLSCFLIVAKALQKQLLVFIRVHKSLANDIWGLEEKPLFSFFLHARIQKSRKTSLMAVQPLFKKAYLTFLKKIILTKEQNQKKFSQERKVIKKENKCISTSHRHLVGMGFFSDFFHRFWSSEIDQR